MSEGFAGSAPGMGIAVRAMLEQHPDAMVAAIGDDGLFVPMPASVPTTGHHLLAGRSALDLVVPDDRVVVIGAWERARTAGTARVLVRLRSAPDEHVPLHILDARAVHGAFLAVLLATQEPEAMAALELAPRVRPRLGHVRKDAISVFIDADPAFCEMLGLAPEDVAGMRSLDLIHPDDQDRAIETWMTMLAEPQRIHRARLRHRTDEGSWVWMEVANENLLDDPAFGYVAADVLDISDEMAAQDALREREELLYRLAESLPIGIVQVDLDGHVVYTNERIREVVGSGPADTIGEQMRGLAAADRPLFDAELAATLRVGTDGDIEVRMHLPGLAEPRWVACTMRPLTHDGGEVSGAIICVADVTERARMRRELERRATFDALTGCHNRASVMAELAQTLQGPGPGTAVLFVDLDRFKDVNDVHGHAAGDDLLMIAAQRLRRAVRPSDVIGRIGGDEFLIVLPEVVDEAGASRLAERVGDALRLPATLRGQAIDVVASIGVAWRQAGRGSADKLVAEADTAMYESKRDGQGRPVLFTGQLRASGVPVRSSDGTGPLRAALAQGRLAVHFQPIVALASGEPVGYEALLRWRRRRRALVAAQEFIELAEATGMIVEIGAWVYEEVCRQAAEVAGPRVGDLRWFVNMSPAELCTAGTGVALGEAAARHGVPPSALVVEVTEHLSITDEHTARRNVQALADLGAAIALDDFGTGWSSLERLRTLPVGWVKVARSFIADLGHDPSAEHILAAVFDLAERLGVQTVVEGVETPEQLDHLRSIGATLAQGFHLGQVLPLADHVRAGVQSGLRGSVTAQP